MPWLGGRWNDDVMNPPFAAGKPVLSRCVRLAMFVSLVMAFLSVMSACATGQPFVRGSVTAVDSVRIQVRHKSGQVVSIGLHKATTYRWDHTSASASDVVIGARVMVILQQSRGPFTAQEVRIFTRPKTLRP